MTRRLSVLLTVLALGVSGLSGPTHSQETEKPQDAGIVDMQAAWAKAGTPGTFHKYLEALQGNWKMDGKSWMAPGAQPMTWGGTSKKEMVLGGRFLREDLTSEMMGQVFTGVGISGYSNVTQKYWHVWYDDMSTGVTLSEGTCDEKGKVFTLVGEYDDPMTGGRSKAKTVLTVVSDDKHIFEAIDIKPDGSEFKSMEITYTRM